MVNAQSSSNGHAARRTKEYDAWRGMRTRCLNKRNKDFHKYGGRGITVCARWNTFLNFLEDMGPAPSLAHQMDRIDNNKGYCPENCRWTTAKNNTNNRRVTKFIIYKGKEFNFTDLCRKFGWTKDRDFDVLRNRIFRDGWPVEEALRAPKMSNADSLKRAWSASWGYKKPKKRSATSQHEK